TAAYRIQPETIKRLRPNRSERSPPHNELSTFMAWCAAQSNNESGIETPTLRARRIRNPSVEFDRVNSARITRKRLKLPSKPRNERLRGPAGSAAASCDSRIKNIATSTAAIAGTAAQRKTHLNSARDGASRLLIKK